MNSVFKYNLLTRFSFYILFNMLGRRIVKSSLKAPKSINLSQTKTEEPKVQHLKNQSLTRINPKLKTKSKIHNRSSSSNILSDVNNKTFTFSTDFKKQMNNKKLSLNQSLESLNFSLSEN